MPRNNILISHLWRLASFQRILQERVIPYLRTFVRDIICEYFSTAVFCNRSGRRRPLFTVGDVRNVFHKARLSCEDISSRVIFVVDSGGFTLSSDIENPPIHDTSYCNFFFYDLPYLFTTFLLISTIISLIILLISTIFLSLSKT